MKEFEIRVKSARDVLAFVNQATLRPFPVKVDNGRHQVNGKSFMEMVCLNCSRPLKAIMDCTEEEFQQFRRDIRGLLVEE